jgi:replicative DNA helicase
MPRELKPYAMNWITEKIEESFLKYHTKIVFIDHLHFLFDLARMKNTSLEIGRVIRHLKQTAVTKNMIIFILCHTQKVDPEGEIGYSAIRDSSFVAQESDCVFMIQRDSSISPTGARLYVEFHRRSGVMRELIEIELKNGIFQEPDRVHKDNG